MLKKDVTELLETKVEGKRLFFQGRNILDSIEFPLYISVPSMPSSSYPSSGDSCGCRCSVEELQPVNPGSEEEPASLLMLTSKGDEGAPPFTDELSELVSRLLDAEWGLLVITDGGYR